MSRMAVVGHIRGRNRRGIVITVSREVVSTPRALYPRTRAPWDDNPNAHTARPRPELAIVRDVSTFSTLARIIADECSGNGFYPSAWYFGAPRPTTRLDMSAGILRRLTRRGAVATDAIIVRQSRQMSHL